MFPALLLHFSGLLSRFYSGLLPCFLFLAFLLRFGGLSGMLPCFLFLALLLRFGGLSGLLPCFLFLALLLLSSGLFLALLLHFSGLLPRFYNGLLPCFLFLALLVRYKGQTLTSNRLSRNSSCFVEVRGQLQGLREFRLCPLSIAFCLQR